MCGQSRNKIKFDQIVNFPRSDSLCLLANAVCRAAPGPALFLCHQSRETVEAVDHLGERQEKEEAENRSQMHRKKG